MENYKVIVDNTPKAQDINELEIERLNKYFLKTGSKLAKEALLRECIGQLKFLKEYYIHKNKSIEEIEMGTTVAIVAEKSRKILIILDSVVGDRNLILTHIFN